MKDARLINCVFLYVVLIRTISDIGDRKSFSDKFSEKKPFKGTIELLLNKGSDRHFLMLKFQNKYRIPSTRLQKWNYGWNGPNF